MNPDSDVLNDKEKTKQLLLSPFMKIFDRYENEADEEDHISFEEFKHISGIEPKS